MHHRNETGSKCSRAEDEQRQTTCVSFGPRHDYVNVADDGNGQYWRQVLADIYLTVLWSCSLLNMSVSSLNSTPHRTVNFVQTSEFPSERM